MHLFRPPPVVMLVALVAPNAVAADEGTSVGAPGDVSVMVEPRAIHAPAVEPPAHPQLTPLGYRLSAQKEHHLAARRQAVKARRLNEVGARLDDARRRGDEALVVRLQGVIERLQAGPPAPRREVNAWASEHVAHLRALDQWRRFGAQLDEPSVIREFEKHAWRIAQLRRAREVVQTTAESLEREALQSQIDIAIETEAARHEAQLEQWLTPRGGNTP